MGVELVLVVGRASTIQRFRQAFLLNPLEPLLVLKHEETLMEYHDKSELHVSLLRREERVMLENIFLIGLKEEL